jgi:DNA-binding NarL/FixJ family response regulator
MRRCYRLDFLQFHNKLSPLSDRSAAELLQRIDLKLNTTASVFMQASQDPAETAASKKRIFIVEDHPVFRQGLTHIINAENDLAVCGHAGDVTSAMDAIPELGPDLAVVDISLPGKNGLELIKELRAANSQIKILVVSMHDEALYAGRVLRAGGDGYIMKQEDPEEIVNAIRDILAGHLYVSEEIFSVKPHGSGKSAANGHASKRPLQDLTDQELEILELIGQGKTNSQIATELQLRPADVSARSADIRKKLNLARSKDLLRYAVCWVETGVA